MAFHNVEEALHAIENLSPSSEIHLQACHYLAGLDEDEEAKGLVQSLESDDPGVRWEASNILVKMGVISASAVLKAMMDPRRVSDPRLQEGVIHMIHVFDDPHLKIELEPLVNSLQGPVADIATMWEAYRLLQKIQPAGLPEE